MATLPKIIDAHIHLYDYQANKHAFLEVEDATFVDIVGDYSGLPRKYLWEDYRKDSANYQINGVVWYEYLSTDPVKEAKWAQDMITKNNIPAAMVTLVDFLDPKLEEKLAIYRSLPNVTAVREHLGWDHNNPKKRFASRADLLTDPLWQQGIARLKDYPFRCVLEVFTPQLPDLMRVISNNPHTGFIIAEMAWPLDLSDAGYEHWKRALKELSSLKNICFEIHALECIFGMQWTVEQVKPWILSAIEILGTKRCMFGSHMSVAKLSRSFDELYKAYEEIVADCSDHEKEDLFHNVAAEWFRLD